MSEQAVTDKPAGLDDRYVGDLIVQSFRFSQGSEGVGGFVLAYMMHEQAPENFPNGITQGAIDAAAPIVRQIRNHAHGVYRNAYSTEVDEAYAKRTIYEQVDALSRFGPQKRTLPVIGMKIIDRDARFLLGNEANGRHRGKPGRRQNGRQQAIDMEFLSHFCYYGLAGHTTGFAEYDAIFAGISDPEAIGQLRKADTASKPAAFNAFPVDRFEKVLELHFAHFPEDRSLVQEPKRAALRDLLGEAVVGELDLAPALPAGYRWAEDIRRPERASLKRAVGWNASSVKEGMQDDFWQHIADAVHDVGVRAGDDQLVGYGRMARKGVSAELGSFAVHPDHRRRGIGKAIIDERLRQAEAAGVTSIYIAPLDDTNTLRSYYEERGFREDPKGAMLRGPEPRSIA